MSAPTEPGPDRWTFLRDVLVFQVKLVLDGLRDAALVPVSLAAALMDLVSGDRTAGRWFYRSVAIGRRSERWIELFEAANRIEPDEAPLAGGRLDDAVARLEKLLAEQHARGGVTASAKQAIDRALDTLAPGYNRSSQHKR